MWWHTVTHRRGSEVGKLANAVGIQYPSHYLGTRCIQHYYRWCRTPRLPAVDWTDVPAGRFKWTGPFRTKDEIWFLRMCHHISTGLYNNSVIITYFAVMTHDIRHTMLNNAVTPVNVLFPVWYRPSRKTAVAPQATAQLHFCPLFHRARSTAKAPIKIRFLRPHMPITQRKRASGRIPKYDSAMSQ